VNGGLARLLSPGQPRAGARTKRCPDALFAALKCRAERQGSRVVLQAPPGGRLIERWVDRVPRESSSYFSGNGRASHDGSIRRVPVRGRRLGSLQASPFHEAASTASLAVSTVRDAQPLRGGAERRGRRPSPLAPQEDMRRRRQRFDRVVAVGRQLPRLPGLRLHARALEDLRSNVLHRSVHRGVKPRSSSGPPVSQEASRKRKEAFVVPQSPTAEIPRTHEIRVFVSTVLDGRCRSVTSWQVTPPAKATGTELV
jgi:hypothetical protein